MWAEVGAGLLRFRNGVLGIFEGDHGPSFVIGRIMAPPADCTPGRPRTLSKYSR